MKKILSVTILTVAFLLSACSKGSEVRFANYTTETMDSVIIGKNAVVFVNVERLKESNYGKLKTGNYAVSCVSHSKKRYATSIKIEKDDKNRHTIQIDGSGAISILND